MIQERGENSQPTARITSQRKSVAGFRLSRPSADSEETQREKEDKDVKVCRATEICLFSFLAKLSCRRHNLLSHLYVYIINVYKYSMFTILSI